MLRRHRKLRRWDVVRAARAFPDVSWEGERTKDGYYRCCVKTNGFPSAPTLSLLHTNVGKMHFLVHAYLSPRWNFRGVLWDLYLCALARYSLFYGMDDNRNLYYGCFGKTFERIRDKLIVYVLIELIMLLMEISLISTLWLSGYVTI